MSAILHALLTQLSKPHLTLQTTKQLHALVFRLHLSHDPFYATRLVRLYSINGDLTSARNLFEVTPHRSVYLWNSIIRAYAQASMFDQAYSLFLGMQRSDTRPCNYTFACITRACTEDFNVDGLRMVHGGLMVAGYGSDIVSSSALVVGYSKMGKMDAARTVFDGVRYPDLVLWNSMISGYGSVEMWEESLDLFGTMRRSGEMPDRYTMVGMLSGLGGERLLVIGGGIHCLCLKSDLDSSDHVASMLVSMYARCECLASASKLFKSLLQPDLVTRSALITGFSQSGQCEKALCMFREMNLEAKRADHLLVASVLAACAQLASLKSGSEMHGFILRHGYESQVMVASALWVLHTKASEQVPKLGSLPDHAVITCVDAPRMPRDETIVLTFNPT
uniref:Pentatricopeptide repeat-containing protein n=1 Tax=Kalanchoe fedtschenkoi TaxID=63787 RepID=A0A7N0TU94_KALFE